MMLGLPLETIILIGYVSGAVAPHIAVVVWEGWTGKRLPIEEWGGLLITSLLWPAVIPIAILMIVTILAGRAIRAASGFARLVFKGAPTHD